MTPASQPPQSTLPPMLIIEDSQEDFETLERLLRRSSINIPIQRCTNGDQALAYLCQTDRYITSENTPRPGLIVLDLNLPGIDGREVLRRIKNDTAINRIPVVVFTTSNNPKDMEDCYKSGVDRYIVKPINFEQLKQDVQTLIQYWLEKTNTTLDSDGTL
jgi:CheY-like chemotaxis protein